MEATGASVKEEDHAESLKELQENKTCLKVNANKIEAFFVFLTLLFFFIIILSLFFHFYLDDPGLKNKKIKPSSSKEIWVDPS